MEANMAKTSIPGDYKPFVAHDEFITDFTDKPEDRIDVGILFVGAGPASLAGAIRLAQLLGEEPELMASLGEIPIAIIEKGKYPGAHLLSGAVVNPVAFRKLFPELKESEFPFFGPVMKETVYFLTWRGALPFPVTPPTMQNHGNYVASISKMGAWLAEKAEGLGVLILNETAGMKLIVEGGVVKGVRTGDKGLDRDGNPMGSFQPGSDISAKVTVLGEGTQGHLMQALIEHFEIKRPNPQVHALGVRRYGRFQSPSTVSYTRWAGPSVGGRNTTSLAGALYTLWEGIRYPLALSWDSTIQTPPSLSMTSFRN